MVTRSHRDRAAVHQALREHGFDPAGKRLGDAVGEALREMERR